MVYYGPWPVWFNRFIQSCRFNKEFDFLIFSDNEVQNEEGGNVFFYKLPFSDFLKLAEERLGFSIAIDNPYKLCDLKIVYGLILQKIVSPYEFWGHLDLDVLLGDLKSFFSSDNLNRNDIISTRKEIINGSCTLYRNVDKVNKLYQQIPNFEFLVNSLDSHYIDEYYMTEVVKDNISKGILQVCFQEMLFEDALAEIRGKNFWAITWNKGKMKEFLTCKSYAYFHFIHSKRRPMFLHEEIEKTNYKYLIFDQGWVSYSLWLHLKYIIRAFVRRPTYYAKFWLKKVFYDKDKVY